MSFKRIVFSMIRKRITRIDNARLAAQSPTEGIEVISDIPYIKDSNEKGHLLDIYYPKDNQTPLPLIINIHGGGLFYGYKEINKYYNMKVSSLGYIVISINYRLIPEVVFSNQLADITAAFEWIRDNAASYGADMQKVYLTGDSAGGMLALFSAAINGSKEVAEVFDLKSAQLKLKAIGIICGMYYTEKNLKTPTGENPRIPLLLKMAMGKNYKAQKYYQYLDTERLITAFKLPPCYILTAHYDFLLPYNREFKQILEKCSAVYKYKEFEKPQDKDLRHIFSVINPEWDESNEAINDMLDFFENV